MASYDCYDKHVRHAVQFTLECMRNVKFQTLSFSQTNIFAKKRLFDGVATAWSVWGRNVSFITEQIVALILSVRGACETCGEQTMFMFHEEQTTHTCRTFHVSHTLNCDQFRYRSYEDDAHPSHM